MLVPRMSTAQRTAISSPATGLLVFDTSNNSFWFYNGTAWTDLSASGSSDHITDADNDTRVQVNKGDVDDDIIRFDLGGTEYFRMNKWRLETVNPGFNTAIGQDALSSVTSGTQNVGLGLAALLSNTSGLNNAAVGFYSLLANSSGSDNAAFGSSVLSENSVGNRNTGVGSNALISNTTGSSNVGVGNKALLLNTTGSKNTAVGDSAGVSSNNLTNATAIGANAVASQDSSLVLGNAANVGIGTSAPDEKLHVVGNIKMIDGKEGFGKVLVSDSSGTAGWNKLEPSGWALDADTLYSSADSTLTIKNGQTGIGTSSPHSSAKLDISSTTQGFLPPRMKEAERNAIPTPVAGLIVWCTDCGGTGELQVHSGSAWTNMMGGPADTAIYIGEYYQGGVIFYLDGNGGGLICSVSDLAGGAFLLWWNGDFITIGTTATAVGTGQANTTAIINAQGAGNYAATVCDNYTVGSYSDWFLPSKDELNEMYINKATIDSAAIANGGSSVSNKYFWSSSEYSWYSAWKHYFPDNNQANNVKSSGAKIRAVRAF